MLARSAVLTPDDRKLTEPAKPLANGCPGRTQCTAEQR